MTDDPRGYDREFTTIIGVKPRAALLYDIHPRTRQPAHQEIRTMAQRERDRPVTDEEIEGVADAVDELGERLVEALAEETDRDPDEFDVDSDDYEFPDPDS